MTGPAHAPFPPVGSGSGIQAPPPGVSPGVRALLWFVALAGLVLGVFVLFLGVAATTQGSGVAPAAIGVLVGIALLLGALYQIRILVVNARAQRDFEAARADLAHGSRDARARSEDRPEAD